MDVTAKSRKTKTFRASCGLQKDGGPPTSTGTLLKRAGAVRPPWGAAEKQTAARDPGILHGRQAAVQFPQLDEDVFRDLLVEEHVRAEVAREERLQGAQVVGLGQRRLHCGSPIVAEVWSRGTPSLRLHGGRSQKMRPVRRTGRLQAAATRGCRYRRKAGEVVIGDLCLSQLSRSKLDPSTARRSLN